MSSAEFGLNARLNKMDKLEFLQGDSAQELLQKLKTIRLATEVLSIYAIGTKHVAWIYTEAKIEKKTKNKRE